MAEIAQREITQAAAGPAIDVNIASVVVPIRSNIKGSSENMTAALKSSSNRSIQESSSTIATIITDIVDKTAPMDMGTLAREVRTRMESKGMDPQLIEEATRPGVIDTALTAALSPVDVEIASLLVKMNVLGPEKSQESIMATIRRIPGIADSPREDVIRAAKIFQEVGANSPASLSVPKETLKRDFVAKGMPDKIAGELAAQRNIGLVAMEMPGRVEIPTAVLPTLIGIDFERNTKSIALKLSEMPEIGNEAEKVSGGLVKMVKSSPAALRSSDTMRRGLIDLRIGISDGAAIAASSPLGLRLITLATRNTVRETKADELGGIDINPAFLKLLVKRDGKGIPIPTAKVPVKDTDIYGFEPVISKVEQVDNLPAFIGIEGGTGTSTDRNIQ